MRTARVDLSKLVGAAVDVSGKVLKRVKREGQCKLVIEPVDVRGFVVFADCRARKNRYQSEDSEGFVCVGPGKVGELRRVGGLPCRLQKNEIKMYLRQ